MVKKTCQAFLEELIAVVSTLFIECQNSTLFRRYDRFNFQRKITKNSKEAKFLFFDFFFFNAIFVCIFFKKIGKNYIKLKKVKI